ncbi:MAG: lysozyme, partial [Pseudomonadota bacterium]
THTQQACVEDGGAQTAPVYASRPDARPVKRRRERLTGFTKRLRERRGSTTLPQNAAESARNVRPKSGRNRRRKAVLGLSAAAISLGSAGLATSISANSPVAIESIQADAATVGGERLPAVQLSASTALKEALAQEEGVRLTVYRDVAGHATVGVGHWVVAADGLNVGDVITYDHAIDLLERDLAQSEAIVSGLVGDLPLYQHEFDALVDLVYNVGEGTVSPQNSPALNAAIKRADYEAIADELAYQRAGGRMALGLAYRSERRKAIFEDASYHDPRPANLALADIGIENRRA